MHTDLRGNRSTLTAYALALALLCGLTMGGAEVWRQLSMAPGTLLPAGATGAGASAAPAGTARSGPRIATSSASVLASGPGWETLTPAQKLALRPLAERWALVSEVQKRRWVALAQNFPALPAEEQVRLHGRMTEWASLSSQQRTQARLNFAVSNQLAPEDKRAQWEAYQALTDTERKALAAKAAPKPKGAATALRPVPPQKLAQVPAAAQANPNRPNAPKIPPMTDHAPRVAAPVPIHAPASSQEPLAHTAVQPVVVETAPIAAAVAEPTALPPLSATTSDAAHPSSLPLTPDTSGLYPQ